jgi:hypothetical protein
MPDIVITGNPVFNKTFQSLANHNPRYQVLDTGLGSVNVFTLLLNKIVAVCKRILFDKSPYDKSAVRDNLNDFFGKNIERLKLQDTETLLKVKKTLALLQNSFAKGTETVDATHEQVKKPMGAESLYEAIDAVNQAIASKSDLASQTSSEESDKESEVNPYTEELYKACPDESRRKRIREYVGNNRYMIDLYMKSPQLFKDRYGVEL